MLHDDPQPTPPSYEGNAATIETVARLFPEALTLLDSQAPHFAEAP